MKFTNEAYSYWFTNFSFSLLKTQINIVSTIGQFFKALGYRAHPRSPSAIIYFTWLDFLAKKTVISLIFYSYLSWKIKYMIVSE